MNKETYKITKASGRHSHRFGTADDDVKELTILIIFVYVVTEVICITILARYAVLYYPIFLLILTDSTLSFVIVPIEPSFL